MKNAENLSPLTIEKGRSLGVTYYWAGRYDDAIAQFRKVVELAPQDSQTHEALADVFARKMMYKDAIAELQQAFTIHGDRESADGIGQDFERIGYEAVIKQLNQGTLNAMKESTGQGYVSPVDFANIFAKLGEADQAFLWLGRAYEERAPWLTNIKTDPAFEPLRSDPRFAELLRKIGLPANP
jgi:tetratricopeptide (TPR) repeat protein